MTSLDVAAWGDLTPQQYELLGKSVPYGWWTMPNGDEFLFDRKYRVLGKNGKFAPQGPVTGGMREQWFFNDSGPPWVNVKGRNARAQIAEKMKEWAITPQDIRFLEYLRKSAKAA